MTARQLLSPELRTSVWRGLSAKLARAEAMIISRKIPDKPPVGRWAFFSLALTQLSRGNAHTVVEIGFVTARHAGKKANFTVGTFKHSESHYSCWPFTGNLRL